MYALRSVAEGWRVVLKKALPQIQTQLPAQENLGEQKSSLPKNLPKSLPKVQEILEQKVQIEPQQQIYKQEEEIHQQEKEIIQPENNEGSNRKSSNNEYLHAGEDFYNVDGYESGRYNLRKRGGTKKYYDENMELEEDIEMNKYKKAMMAEEYNQNNTGVNSGFGMGGYAKTLGSDSNKRNKQRRKKKDDDEDYVAEEEPEDNDELSPEKNQAKQNGRNNFNPMGGNQFGNGGLPQYGNMGMMGNLMPLQYVMGGQMRKYFLDIHLLEFYLIYFIAMGNRNMAMMAMQNRGQPVMPGMPGMLQNMQGFPGGVNMPGNLNSMSWMLNNQNTENMQGTNPQPNNMPNNVTNNIPPVSQNTMPTSTGNLPANGMMGNGANNTNFNGTNPGNQAIGGMQPSNFPMGGRMNYPNNMMNNFSQIQR